MDDFKRTTPSLTPLTIEQLHEIEGGRMAQWQINLGLGTEVGNYLT